MSDFERSFRNTVQIACVVVLYLLFVYAMTKWCRWMTIARDAQELAEATHAEAMQLASENRMLHGMVAALVTERAGRE